MNTTATKLFERQALPKEENPVMYHNDEINLNIDYNHYENTTEIKDSQTTGS